MTSEQNLAEGIAEARRHLQARLELCWCVDAMGPVDELGLLRIVWVDPVP